MTHQRADYKKDYYDRENPDLNAGNSSHQKWIWKCRFHLTSQPRESADPSDQPNPLLNKEPAYSGNDFEFPLLSGFCFQLTQRYPDFFFQLSNSGFFLPFSKLLVACMFLLECWLVHYINRLIIRANLCDYFFALFCSTTNTNQKRAYYKKKHFPLLVYEMPCI